MMRKAMKSEKYEDKLLQGIENFTKKLIKHQKSEEKRMYRRKK